MKAIKEKNLPIVYLLHTVPAYGEYTKADWSRML